MSAVYTSLEMLLFVITETNKLQVRLSKAPFLKSDDKPVFNSEQFRVLGTQFS